MDHDVFICFSSKDIEIANRFCSDIEKFGIKCWISSRDIDPGDDFQDAIVSAIESSKIILLIFSSNSDKSVEVRRELLVASNHSIRIVPARIENILPTRGMQYILSTHQYLDLFGNWESNIRKAADRIYHYIGPPSGLRLDGASEHDVRSTPEAEKPEAEKHEAASPALQAPEASPPQSAGKTTGERFEATPPEPKQRTGQRRLLLGSGIGAVIAAGVTAWAVLGDTSQLPWRLPTFSPHDQQPGSVPGLTPFTGAGSTGSAARSQGAEQRAWDDAVHTDTVEAYRSYLAAYPQGTNAARANHRIDELQPAKSEGARGAEQRAWDNAARTNTPDAYRTYLATYPLGADAAEAQNELGVMYQNGRGVPQSDTEAVGWYRLAAAQGYAPAQVYLGWMYRNGRGVSQSDTEAVSWYRLAAERGNALGQNNLGTMYENGRGVSQDYAEALRLYQLAADQGNALAQNNLGTMYENGRGVTQNFAEAVHWYRLAAEQGNACGQNNLGVMYEKGRGVRQDYAEALRWYRLAADRGERGGARRSRCDV